MKQQNPKSKTKQKSLYPDLAKNWNQAFCWIKHKNVDIFSTVVVYYLYAVLSRLVKYTG